MGTFEGHLLPGFSFIGLGVWHLYNVIALYLRSSSSSSSSPSPSTDAPIGRDASLTTSEQAGDGVERRRSPTASVAGRFRTRAWFPAKLPGALQYLELILIACAASASILAEMIVSQPGHWMLDEEGHIPIHMLAQFEHASMSLFFLLYSLLALLTETGIPGIPPLPFGFLHIIGACALAQEYLLFFFHSGDHMGVEGQYHTLLRVPIAIALACTLLEVAWPHQFLLPLVRSSAMSLQGLLFVQTAVSIFTPGGVALHCHIVPGHHVACEGEEWEHRAKAMANLQFNWLAAAQLLFTVLLFVSMRCSHHRRSFYSSAASGWVGGDGKRGYVRVPQSTQRTGNGGGQQKQLVQDAHDVDVEKGMHDEEGEQSGPTGTATVADHDAGDDGGDCDRKHLCTAAAAYGATRGGPRRHSTSASSSCSDDEVGEGFMPSSPSSSDVSSPDHNPWQ